ncbi:MAG: heme-binding protein [Cypionkella sp.]|nr:heme-binding protein [Cypionkella sp.]
MLQPRKRANPPPPPLARHGLIEADYADAGGAVPVQVAGVGVVAVVTVSGLPQLDDHALVISAMRDYLA